MSTCSDYRKRSAVHGFCHGFEIPQHVWAQSCAPLTCPAFDAPSGLTWHMGNTRASRWLLIGAGNHFSGYLSRSNRWRAYRLFGGRYQWIAKDKKHLYDCALALVRIVRAG